MIASENPNQSLWVGEGWKIPTALGVARAAWPIGGFSSSPSYNHIVCWSFLPTPPQHIFIPQQGSVQGLGWTPAQPWWVWHSDTPKPLLELHLFFFLHTLPASRGLQNRRRITPGRDVTALCQEWDSQWHVPGDTGGEQAQWHVPGDTEGEQAQRCTVSLLGNLPRLPHTRQNPKGIANSGNRIKKTYLKWYPTVMQQRKNVCLSLPDDSIPSRELPASKLPAQHHWMIWQHYHKA